MTLIKSISGIRGTIGGNPEEGLNPLAIVKFVAAYATFIRKNTKVTTNKIVVGRDARISGPMVKNVVLGTLMGMGFDVVDIDLATTPTTELAVTMEGACGGIILTASHNPKQWNALKLLNEKGEFLNAAEGAEVLALAAKDDFTFADVDHLGKIITKTDYIQKHIDSVLKLDLVDVEAIKAANKQARIVADNLVFGNTETYKGSMGTSIAKVFDLTVAAAGANAKLLQRARIPFIASWTHGSSHADYYPGAQPLSIKVLFAPETGVLLGAQVVGTEGVDKRIEMLAQLIQHGGTVQDLMELEHAYAPPYSSAKDPVNIAGFVADNILKGRVRIMTWREVARLKEATMKIDVRTREEFAQGSIPGFINIPVDELREHLSELPRNVMIVLTCAVGLRGYVAYRILTQSGFNELRNLSGGYKTWYMATHY